MPKGQIVSEERFIKEITLKIAKMLKKGNNSKDGLNLTADRSHHAKHFYPEFYLTLRFRRYMQKTTV